MGLNCKLLGHVWDETNPYKQNCKKCNCTRWLVINKYPEIGEPLIDWRVIDYDELAINFT